MFVVWLQHFRLCIYLDFKKKKLSRTVQSSRLGSPRADHLPTPPMNKLRIVAENRINLRQVKSQADVNRLQSTTELHLFLVIYFLMSTLGQAPCLWTRFFFPSATYLTGLLWGKKERGREEGVMCILPFAPEEKVNCNSNKTNLVILQ